MAAPAGSEVPLKGGAAAADGAEAPAGPPPPPPPSLANGVAGGAGGAAAAAPAGEPFGDPALVPVSPDAPPGSMAFQVPPADVSDLQKVRNYMDAKKFQWQRFQRRPAKERLRRVVGTAVPFVRQAHLYTFKKFLQDVLAGVTVGCILVPQSLSYAGIAGLAPMYGLYAGLTGLYAYAVFGSSRELAVGPVALLSLLTANAISSVGLVESGVTPPEIYAQHAFFLTWSTGLLTMAAGLVRLGFILNFISDAVVTGFISATAIVILAQQVRNIFAWPNYKYPRSELISDNIGYFINGCKSGQPNWANFGMFWANFFFLLFFRYAHRLVKKPRWFKFSVRMTRYFMPLLCLVVSTAISAGLNLKSHGVPVVGKIPPGLPGVNTAFFFDGQMWKDYLGQIILITLVGHIEAVAIARNLATKNHYLLSHNGEMFSLGFMCVFGALFQSYPLTGSFSRSAVNNELGAKSQVSGAVTATIVLFTLLVLTPLFKYTPQATLAAIVWYAVIFLINPGEWLYIWKTSLKNFFVCLVVFVLTGFVGIEYGIGVGVLISLFIILWETQHPNTVALGRLPGTDGDYVDINQYPEALTHPNIFIWRFDSSLYYPCVHYFRERMDEFVVEGVHQATFGTVYNSIYSAGELFHNPEDAEADEARRNLYIPASQLKVVILDLSGAAVIDITGAIAIRDVFLSYKNLGVDLLLTGLNVGAIASLERTKAVDDISWKRVFVRLEDAVAYAKALAKVDKDRPVLYSASGRLEEAASQGGEDEYGLRPPTDARDYKPTLMLHRRSSSAQADGSE